MSRQPVVLHRREPHPYASAREVSRARAHQLLDAVRTGRTEATQSEITSALWATGDMVPVVRRTGEGEPMG